ncbi:hypothetical protein BDV95DRAFT_607895 [Massariosphaeria phaeospora]|uniref:Uncharacterized protein n=1 Tax=Massariosphaeria phaeospora TaxID=100035 RepID=A0A7C8MDQ1_9PLEO|nr:hypothetical protein BDV95DRAFT_607895 [Massariosphaeria phaeospora]
MHTSISATLVVLAHFIPSAVLAIPKVTVSPLSNGCSAYPGYSNTTGQAGPWTVVADSTGSSIDGLKISAESFTDDGVNRWGFVTLPKGSPNVANITLRCANSTLQASLPDWVDLSIASEENWQSSFSWNISPAVPVQPYAHYINGQKQAGVFLGAGNSTTWNFKYNWGGVVGEYYLLRLADATMTKTARGTLRKRQDFPVLDDRDWVGFLKVVE